MKVLHAMAIVAMETALVTSAVAQGLPSKKILTIDVAQSIVHEAIIACRANGYKISVLVVDDSNRMKAFLRDDGAINATIEVAQMKANSVLAFGRPSGPPPSVQAGQPVPPPIIFGTINSQGGTPIIVDDQVIGAVAVSGAPTGDKDAACANAALAKLADSLK